MKFWKSLNNLIEETLPDWRDKFLSYKDLKKQLKSIYPKEGDTDICNKRRRLDDDGGLDHRTVENVESGGGGGGGEDEEEEAVVVTKEVNDFVKMLEDEMEKFNGFFVEKEEEYVITWKELQDRVAKAKDSNRDLMEVGREIVDFHGEMVLLENYSALNYTGLVKILKKYDKRSGALIRLPFIQKIIQQPFFSTDLLKKLVKECESVLDHLFSMNEPSTSSPYEATVEKEGSKTETANENGKRLLEVPNELSEIESMESMYGKLTLSALRVLKEIRSGSSTVSVFSLPPLQTNLVEDWKKVPVLEQAAK